MKARSDGDTTRVVKYLRYEFASFLDPGDLRRCLSKGLIREFPRGAANLVIGANGCARTFPILKFFLVVCSIV